MSSKDIYGPVKTGWSREETELLIQSWLPHGNYDELQKLFPQFSLSKIKKKRREVDLEKKPNKIVVWKQAEIDILRRVWSTCHKTEEILHLFPGRDADAIGRKAYSLCLQKTDEVKLLKLEEKRKIFGIMNQTILGTKQSYERCEYLARQCKSMQEFKKKHGSQYVYARQNGFLDEICEHMIVGDSFSYPQAFLFGCIKELFPEETILYNDRKTIHPRELDVYIPNLKIAFEYDGFNFHKNDDDTKDRICESLGITLYHIKEECKPKPEMFIIRTLESFGYDCAQLDVQKLTEFAFSKKISKEHITECTSSVTTMKEFRRSFPNLYTWLYRRNLLDKYCSHLEPFWEDIDKNDLLNFINSKTRKSEVIGTKYYRALNRKFRDDAEVIYAYNGLAGRLKMKML